MADKLDRSKLPIPEPPFEGKVGKTYLDSKSSWRIPQARFHAGKEY